MNVCVNPNVDLGKGSSEMKQGTIVTLAIVNILLQFVDGLASYHILSAGVPEENPLVATYIAHWGVFGGLLYSKAIGCVLVILIFMLRKRVEAVVVHGLTIMACVYSVLAVLLIMKMVVLFA
jgi:hypothetical protein